MRTLTFSLILLSCLVMAACGGSNTQSTDMDQKQLAQGATSGPASQPGDHKCTCKKHGEKGEHGKKGGHHGQHGEGMGAGQGQQQAHQHHFDQPEKFAARWNSPERDGWQKPAEVIALMEISPGMTVADLGAGTGYFAPHLSKAVGDQGKVMALDIEDAMIKYLQGQISAQSWANVEAVKVPTDGPGVADASLDRLLTVNTWHHIEDRQGYATKLFQALKPGGVVVVVDYTKDAQPGPHAHFRLEPQQIMDELKAGGFQVEQADESLPRQYIIIARKP